MVNDNSEKEITIIGIHVGFLESLYNTCFTASESTTVAREIKVHNSNAVSSATLIEAIFSNSSTVITPLVINYVLGRNQRLWRSYQHTPTIKFTLSGIVNDLLLVCL